LIGSDEVATLRWFGVFVHRAQPRTIELEEEEEFVKAAD
jgi:hypothetical protein